MSASGVFVHEKGLCESSEVGDGTRIWAHAHVMKGAVLGHGCNIGEGSFIEKGARLGSFCTVKNGVSVWDKVTCEDYVFLGPDAAFTNDFLPRAAFKKDPDTEFRATLLCEGSSIGANATIVCGVTIGRHGMVGAGAVVTKDVPDFGLVVGCPARRIGWVGRYGTRLEFDAAGEARCEKTGDVYRLSNGVVSIAKMGQPSHATLRKTHMGAAKAGTKDTVDVGRIFAAHGPARVSRFAEKIPVSSILKIAGEIREMQARGVPVLDLTVGDFHPSQFPVPQGLVDGIVDALEHHETNYPPVQGVKALREALAEMTREDLGLEYSPDCFLVAGGARPLLYSGYTSLVDEGEVILYPVPSWNNHHYVRLCGGEGVEIRGTPETNFHPDRAAVEPHLSRARIVALNSPLNPTGTCIGREQLRGICEAIVEENERRRARDERSVFVLYDQVYGNLTFGREHFTPVGLVPEIAPYTLLIDAVSKGLCGTGLRVGWVAAPPEIVSKMAALLGHYGSWAPRAEQIATAHFLRDRPALLEHRRWMIRELSARLQALDTGLSAMRAAGLPVEHIEPQGAIYLSVRFGLLGRRVAGNAIRHNEDLRQVLLNQAGFAVVPFEAFGGEGHDGWVRLSVGAVGVEAIEAGLARVRELLGRAE